MAEFVRTEGAATSVVIVAGEPSLGLSGAAAAFVETFEALGGDNLAFEVAEADGSNAADVIAAVVASAKDLLGRAVAPRPLPAIRYAAKRMRPKATPAT